MNTKKNERKKERDRKQKCESKKKEQTGVYRK